MRALLLALAALVSLSACAGRVQFNSETEPYPDDYREVARTALAGTRGAAEERLSISAPRTMVGETVGSPQRWYVCVRGIPTNRQSDTGLKPLFDAVADAVDPRPEIFDVIVIFRGDRTPYRVEAFDAELCRDGDYSPFTLPDV